MNKYARINVSTRAQNIADEWKKTHASNGTSKLPSFCWQTLEEELVAAGVPQWAIDTQKAWDINHSADSTNVRECGFRYS